MVLGLGLGLALPVVVRRFQCQFSLLKGGKSSKHGVKHVEVFLIFTLRNDATFLQQILIQFG